MMIEHVHYTFAAGDEIGCAQYNQHRQLSASLA
jgi:hypothetical protein